MFVMVDCVREMTLKKSCKSGKFGLCEHLPFLLHILMIIVQKLLHFCCQ